MDYSEKQQQLYKAMEKTFKENFKEQIDFNKTSINNKLKATLTEMANNYDTLSDTDFYIYFTKISQLMMARAMFNVKV